MRRLRRRKPVNVSLRRLRGETSQSRQYPQRSETRAGRDRQKSKCVLLLSENSQSQSRRRLETGGAQPPTHASRPQEARDDISTVLFFHGRAFPSQNEEAETAKTVYNNLCVSDTIPLGEDAEKRNASKRALHRLAVLGVVEDYCIEGWGNNETATVVTSDVGPNEIAEKLLAFVARSQPGRVTAFRERLPQMASSQISVWECSRLLAEFVFDTIGRARQRSLYEMWELAVSGSQDGENIRRGVLDYLSEGVPSATALRLAELQQFAYADWIVEWATIASSDDARQWRAASARLLGSYPDHPGLLASRALAGALLPNRSADELESGFQDSMQSALDRYQCDPSDAEDMAMWALDWLTAASEGTTVSPLDHEPMEQRLRIAATVIAAARATLPSPTRINQWLDNNWQRNPHLAVFQLSDEIAEATVITRQIINPDAIQTRNKQKEVTRWKT